VLQERGDAGAVGVEDLEQPLAVDQRRAVRHAAPGVERGNLLGRETDGAVVLQNGNEAREDGVGGAGAV